MKIETPKKQIEHLLRIRNILVATMIFLIIGIFFTILNIVNAEKTNYGLTSAGINIGGLNKIELEQRLKELNVNLSKQEISLVYQDKAWQTNPEKLGIAIDVEKSALFALAYGHNQNLFINCWQQLKSLLGKNLELAWQIDEEKLEKFLINNLNQIHRPAQNATLVYDPRKQTFTAVEEKNGIIIDKQKLKNDLTQNIAKNHRVIKLSLSDDFAEVKITETQQAQQKIKEIISLVPIPIYISEKESGEKTEVAKIEKDDLLNLISFEPVIDPNNPINKILGININQEMAKQYLISLAPLINREPVDAKLTFKNGRVMVFALSQEGIRLEIEKNIPVIADGILKNQEIILKITKIKPNIGTEEIDNLGITSLLGRGVSNFAGSPSSRVHNIKISAAKFNGILIKPGEEFSFNTVLGEVGPEQGYEPELVIKRDKTIPEYGGGICQVSTTIFRAAVNSGLFITERFAHAFPVKYYNPQGFDATIYPPSPDLKFINNTPSNILIQSKITGTELTFEFYGTEDFRTVKIIGPKQYDIKPDGSMKAMLTQEVYDKDGNLMFKKTFYSNYKSPDLYPVERNPLE